MSLVAALAPLAATANPVIATAAAHAATPYPSQDGLVQEARDALQRREKSRLAQLAERARQGDHPLASWIDYWAIGLRLAEARHSDLEAFYQRWPGTYVEDRLRNDWLLELGRRRDWSNFSHDYPRFRMNDDRSVHCYAVLAEHEGGATKPALAERARAAWMAQREADDGCRTLGERLVHDKVLTEEDAWRKLQQAVEVNRPRVARQTADLLPRAVEKAVPAILDNAVKYLDGLKGGGTGAQGSTGTRLAALALARRAQESPDDAARRLRERWAGALSADWLAWTWAQIGRQAGFKGMPEAAGYYRLAWEAADRGDRSPAWSDEVLAWGVRSALRSADALSWRLVLRAVDAMSETEQRDASWQYWRARALQFTARSGPDGQAQRDESRRLLHAIASPLNFYGKLALEDLDQPIRLPAKPAPATATERDAALQHPGLTRALRLLALGLRSEGVREWNFSIRGMNDRELLAAAQRACDREVWDRCINTSDRTRQEIDLEQRFPTPFRRDVVAKAGEAGLDPAYVYGLIRQESRFITDARSHVGASGLMQVMPATAKWTARKIGLPFRQEMITEREANLTIGTSYLKLVLDDFGGSQAMAAAAYNAGPSRPRRWREGNTLDAAAWAETIPFNETRDYVKKVLSNATLYGALLGTPTPSLKARLGPPIGPRDAAAAPPDRDLP